MLETRMPTTSSRTRRSHSAVRSEAQSLPARSGNALRSGIREQAARVQVSEEPIRRSLPSARQSRLGRSEMRLMGLATASTAVVCALLLLYLAAYAHVTQLGIQQSQARVQLRQNQIRNELLQAERNSLESPQRIVAAAAAQGMTPRGATPIDYVAAQPAAVPQATTQYEAVQDGAGLAGAKQNDVEMASDWDQGSKSGTTEDSRPAASFHH